MPEPLLSARISAGYRGGEPVLREVVLDVGAGEILGLAGQSGSGKSTLALALMGLLNLRGGMISGEIRFRGRDLMPLSAAELRQVRGKEIALILQSPLTALNPALRLRTQFAETWRAHSKERAQWKQAAQEALKQVALPGDDEFLGRLPSQLSVGQAQRVLIAMAILHRPALLIADEPASALDVITQAEILRLFSALNRELHMAILYISHDLLSVASLCHRVAILHRGEIVEAGETASIFESPQHPYTRELLAALPAKPSAEVLHRGPRAAP